MKSKRTLSPAIVDLLYQSFETELGGVEIYRTAIGCAVNPDLAKEWKKYLAETQQHVEAMRGVLEDLGLDPAKDTPGRTVVRHIGKSLVKAMHMAKGADDPASTELVAAECVTLAETKDHSNWHLLSKLVEERVVESRALAAAVEQVEDQEDEHLYHTTGWTRELWIQALGMTPVLPPPEEQRDVKTMAEAADAESSRDADETDEAVQGRAAKGTAKKGAETKATAAGDAAAKGSASKRRARAQS